MAGLYLQTKLVHQIEPWTNPVYGPNDRHVIWPAGLPSEIAGQFHTWDSCSAQGSTDLATAVSVVAVWLAAAVLMYIFVPSSLPPPASSRKGGAWVYCLITFSPHPSYVTGPSHGSDNTALQARFGRPWVGHHCYRCNVSSYLVKGSTEFSLEAIFIYTIETELSLQYQQCQTF